ncbi:BTB/POZ domain-containing protein KCTD3-like [Daphnia magna]|uniref:BTB/POZ domain-containing protein KCTD3-like n=1 Tax=Daphnia magna TaxID=35525 RepID=UPI001E1BBA36|nr:BTB/POZ domain-containing protein KCTD3-like [Daphnia magna]
MAFSTSRQTLTWIPDTFFTSLLSGRIGTLVDDRGPIFIDRDPTVFTHVFNYLHTKEIHLTEGIGMRGLVHEAEFYGITPLTQQLKLVQELEHSSCGDVLYYECLNPPSVPFRVIRTNEDGEANLAGDGLEQQQQNCNTPRQSTLDLSRTLVPPRVSSSSRNGHVVMNRTHSRSSSLDLRLNSLRRQEGGIGAGSHNHLAAWFGGLHVRSSIDPLRVNLIKAHHNWILIAYAHMITCHKCKGAGGWHLVFTSPWMDNQIDRVALNARMTSSGGQNQAPNSSSNSFETEMVALASGTTIRLLAIADDGQRNDIGTFNIHVLVESIFFIDSQVVALSRPPVGKIGVWHSMTRHWQIQDVTPVSSYDTAGSLLLLGCCNGSICFIDVQKFPLRMKDNDLVTELYRNPMPEAITSISVYLTPKTNHIGMFGSWIQIAYETSSGAMRMIVQYPETVGHGPQLFQTFIIHRSPINKVRLSEKYLVSVCSEYNHVRTWSVTRFRGMISTQPGSTLEQHNMLLLLEENTTAFMYSNFSTNEKLLSSEVLSQIVLA